MSVVSEYTLRMARPATIRDSSDRINSPAPAAEAQDERAPVRALARVRRGVVRPIRVDSP